MGSQEYQHCWEKLSEPGSRDYQCGYCDALVGAHKGWQSNQYTDRQVFICPKCRKPTFFDGGQQVPGPKYGVHVERLEPNVESVYAEARSCFQANCFTAVIMLCRKLIMNLAVAKGAKENLKYVQYVDYLKEHNYLPPNTTKKIEFIKDIGNEANHELHPRSQHEAEASLAFMAALLKMVFEFADEA